MPYHGIGFTRARLPISEEATIVAFPGIVEHLLAESCVDLVLVSISGCRLNHHAVTLGLKSIVGPERVVEGEGSLSPRGLVQQDRLGSILSD